ncbi:Golgi transport complex subunit 6 [Allomyces javanicus]|nr:Golgi transport complex subunit 6 [Allomyces javanicus]
MIDPIAWAAEFDRHLAERYDYTKAVSAVLANGHAQRTFKCTYNLQQVATVIMIPVRRRLQEAIACPVFRPAFNDPDGARATADALVALDEWCGDEKELPDGTTLHDDIEDSQLDLYDELIQLANVVEKRIGRYENDIAAMIQSCVATKSVFATAWAGAANFIRDIDAKTAEIDQLRTEEDQLRVFIDDNVLSDDEMALLSSPSPDLSEGFFAALDKARLLEARFASEPDQGSLNAEILDACRMHLETAFDRMYSWVQSHLSVFVVLTPELPAFLPRVLSAFQSRPVLLAVIAEELAGQRRIALQRWFNDALTRGSGLSLIGPLATPRDVTARRGSTTSTTSGAPLELTSYDPLRFVGDLYSWLHNVTTAEMNLWTARAGLPRPVAIELVDKSTLGICRPVQLRVEQALEDAMSDDTGSLFEDIVLPFRVEHLLHVNADLLTRTFPVQANLVAMTRDLQVTSLKLFKSALEELAQFTTQDLQIPDSGELLPTANVQRAVDLIWSMARTHSTYPSVGPAAVTDVKPFLDLIVDPCLQACVIAAQKLPLTDGNVFLLNCLERLKDALQTICESKASALQSQVQIYLDSLVAEHHRALLSESGIASIIDLLDHNPNHESLAQLGCSPVALADAIAQFDAMLISGHPGVAASLTSLTNKEYVTQINDRALGQFMDDYGRLLKAIADERNGELFKDLVPRPEGEVQTLLCL